jgi:hypothetical protein
MSTDTAESTKPFWDGISFEGDGTLLRNLMGNVVTPENTQEKPLFKEYSPEEDDALLQAHADKAGIPRLTIDLTNGQPNLEELNKQFDVVAYNNRPLVDNNKKIKELVNELYIDHSFKQAAKSTEFDMMGRPKNSSENGTVVSPLDQNVPLVDEAINLNHVVDNTLIVDVDRLDLRKLLNDQISFDNRDDTMLKCLTVIMSADDLKKDFLITGRIENIIYPPTPVYRIYATGTLYRNLHIKLVYPPDPIEKIRIMTSDDQVIYSEEPNSAEYQIDELLPRDVYIEITTKSQFFLSYDAIIGSSPRFEKLKLWPYITQFRFRNMLCTRYDPNYVIKPIQ